MELFGNYLLVENYKKLWYNLHINNIGVYKMENKDKIESRRSFLKKAAYAVPTIVALGQITNPVPAAAGSFVGNKTGSETTNPNPPAGKAPNQDSNNFDSLFK